MDDHPQLDGYRLALGEERGVCTNLVISSNPDIPGVLEQIWNPEQLAHGDAIFRTALNLWRLIKKFPYAREEQAA